MCFDIGMYLLQRESCLIYPLGSWSMKFGIVDKPIQEVETIVGRQDHAHYLTFDNSFTEVWLAGARVYYEGSILNKGSLVF